MTTSKPLDTQTQPTGKRIANLSKDSRWRSFPKVPNLLQYVTNGVYFARIKVHGKLIRQSLKTSVWTTAKLRLVDFVKAHQQARDTVAAPKFSEAVAWYEHRLNNNLRIKPQSRQYRRWCLKKIQKSWPELWELPLDQIAPASYREWAARLSKEIACHYYNNTIATLRQVIDVGMEEHKRNGGTAFENLAQTLPRVRIRQKELQLPELSQFHALLKNIRERSGGWGPRIADLLEFLAYSGMRIHSEALWVKWEDVDWQHKEIIVRGDPETGTKNTEVRRVPIISGMETLLKRLQGDSPRKGPILQVTRGHEALARACKELGIPRLTHHDLRHLFATRCIESEWTFRL